MKVKTLRTDRLVLRPLNLEDLEDIYHLFSKDQLMEPYGMNSLASIEDARNLLQTMMEDGEWAITLKENKKLIGTIGFVAYKVPHKRAEIAFELDTKYWAKGYMKESLQAVIQYYFRQTPMNRLEAYVYPRNKASIKVLETLGFQKEGCLRDYVIKRNKYEDFLVYGLLRSDLSKTTNKN